MEWIQIPDNLKLEAKGFAWQDGENDTVTKARHFHLRYVYDYAYQTLCVDVIEDRPDGTSRIILPNGMAEDMQIFHHAVAAIEAGFPSANVTEGRKFTHLANLLDLYQGSYSEFSEAKFKKAQKAMQEQFAELFKAYEYIKKQDQGDPTLSEAFENLVRVDFKSRKKAYKPANDLLEQMRGAIGRMKNHDSPVTKIFGSPEGPS